MSQLIPLTLLHIPKLESDIELTTKGKSGLPTAALTSPVYNDYYSYTEKFYLLEVTCVNKIDN
ncbi:MAG: hypothetical protein V7K89_20305 [Nostoc sp.]|uniref:hypothetical protein n=1 Tax=Nostoc sp. TaxID=1180 RepID=UPI002FFC23B1